MTLEFWRNLSIVWLALLCMIGMVIPLAISVFAVKGMHVLVDRTPKLLEAARHASGRVRAVSEEGSRKVAGPVFTTRRRMTQLDTIVRRLLGARVPTEGNQP